MKFIIIIMLIFFVVIGGGLVFLSFADVDVMQTEISKEIILENE